MGGIVILTFFDKVDLHGAVAAYLNPLVGEGGRKLAPKISSERPLFGIKRVSVKFVVPNELPVFFFGKIRRHVSFDFVFFHPVLLFPLLR